MIHPTIHINGTAKVDLMEQWNNAYLALSIAYEAVNNAAPNARDYYPQGSEAFKEAVLQHAKMMDDIMAAMDVIDQLRTKASNYKTYADYSN